MDLDQKRSLSSALLVTTAEPRRRAQGGIALAAAAALTLCLPAARRETRREAPQLSSTRDIDELPPPPLDGRQPCAQQDLGTRSARCQEARSHVSQRQLGRPTRLLRPWARPHDF